MTTPLQFMDRQPVFERMGELANYANMTYEQQESYMRSLDTWRTVMAAEEFTFTKGHKKGFEKGLAEGREKGLAEGREKGLAEGREKGLAEGIEKGIVEGREKGRVEEKMENARNFKLLGVPFDTIAQATGLTIEEISKL